MGKSIIICFDGTSNDPEDAKQDIQKHGAPVDDSITNIAKLFLSFGGRTVSRANHFEDQVVFYYTGVGTQGHALEKLVNYTFAPKWLDVGRILRGAGENLHKVYEPDQDKIFLFGFSRGAALARRFAATLHEYIQFNTPHPVEFLGVFDTVAAMGEVNLGQTIRPASDVIFENNKISNTVEKALHLVALDEKRNAFKPTLMNPEERVMEIWFAGAHSDVGGGYYHDGLSDVTLQFMMQHLERYYPKLKRRPLDQIDFQDLDPIEYDDVMLDPNPLATSHEQTNYPLVRDHRKCVTGTEEGVALVHHSVIDRINGFEGYKPMSLKKTAHRIYYSSDKIKAYSGLKDHLMRASDPLEALEPAQKSDAVRVYALNKSNKTYLSLRKGESYIFHMEETDKWYDKDVACTPSGWDNEDVRFGLLELGIKASEPLRRNPDAKWFELCGEIHHPATGKSHIFSAYQHRHQPNGASQAFIAPLSGILTLFANDLAISYGNNRGFVTVVIERTG